jgi:hypothetical protein
MPIQRADVLYTAVATHDGRLDLVVDPPKGRTPAGVRPPSMAL